MGHTILGVGIVFPGLGYSPVRVIVFAQMANGVLLPVVALFLVYVMNDEETLGEYTNGAWSNVLGGPVTLVVVWLGVRTPLSIAGIEPL